jgi:hypothetical protein
MKTYHKFEILQSKHFSLKISDYNLKVSDYNFRQCRECVFVTFLCHFTNPSEVDYKRNVDCKDIDNTIYSEPSICVSHKRPDLSDAVNKLTILSRQSREKHMEDNMLASKMMVFPKLV